MSNVTVVVPAFNNARTLEACLLGAGMKVRGGKVRIIVVDNGSQDNTRGIASRLGVEVTSASRPGPAAARNTGLALAVTEYVAFIDADSVPEVDWLENLVKGLSTTTHIGAGGSIRWLSPDPFLRSFYSQVYATNERCCSPEAPSFVLTANAIFRRAEIQDAGGFDPRLRWCEDLELGLRLSRRGETFGYVPQAVISHQVPGSYLDRFCQFYKYGAGLTALHPKYAEELSWWSAQRAWQRILEHASNVFIDRKERRHHMMLLLKRLAYLAGWNDARGRRWLQDLRQSRDELLDVHESFSPEADERGLFLTIDDGPHPNTTLEILHLLEGHRAKATFFVNGIRAEQNPALIKSIIAAGHEVYAHGYTHRRLDCLDWQEICDEMERTEKILRRIRPTPCPYLVRLPYGFGAKDFYVHKALRKWNRNCRIVHWNVSLRDWEIAQLHHRSAAERECDAAVSNVMKNEKLDGAIALLHDQPIGVEGPLVSEVSLMVLAKLLSAVTSQGYRVKAIGGQARRECEQ